MDVPATLRGPKPSSPNQEQERDEFFVFLSYFWLLCVSHRIQTKIEQRREERLELALQEAGSKVLRALQGRAAEFRADAVYGKDPMGFSRARQMIWFPQQLIR